jgi:hypothetical protein
MRFRMGRVGNAALWMGLAVVQIAITSARFQLHHADRMLEVVTICAWTFIFAIYLSQILLSSLELAGGELRIRNAFKTRIVPYDAIVAIRPAKTDGGRPIRDAVELEIAALGATIYPHEYLVVPASDVRSFASAIHEQIPQAEYVPA